MKKITLLLLLFVSTAFYAQSTGISYQAIIYNPNGEVIPGYNNSNSPLANKNICLQFTIVDSATLVEYQEKITVRTDEYGMVNTVIGTGTRTGGYATSFGNINWALPNKSMKVGLDTFGLCTNFIEISNQFFTAVPYSFNAFRADNVTGIVPIQNGGTSANSVLGAKINLGLENVDNTRDINKPISIATQAALNLKEDLSNKSTNVAADGSSNTKYPSVKAVKDYVDASSTVQSAALTNEANIRAAADLLKEDLANKSTNVTTDGASNTKYPSVKAVKDYVDTSINLGGTALTNEANIRAAADLALTNALNTEITSRINFDLLKEDIANKSSNVNTDAASATKYPSVRAIKTYVDASDSNLTTNLNAETAARISGDNSLTANITAEVTRATAQDNTLSNNLLQELVRASAAENTLTTNLSAEITRATAAEATKENLSNKSTNVTTDGASDTKYSSVKSVKTYVDASSASATTAINNEATVRAAADATLTTNLATEVTARTNADLLKEDLVNKSTNVTTDGASDTKYPSVKSVKTYVDATVTAATPDASTTVKGKVQLAGDLTGTAALPTIAANAVTSAKILDGEVVNADISATAAIADTKLATITTAGKVSNSATTATNLNTPNTIVLRDASGNLAAGSITATGFAGPLTGNVLGNLTGNVTGNITGNVIGNVSGTAANVTGIVAIANGGTGSPTQNFVDLTTGQTIAGAKTFSSNVTANSFIKSGGTSSQFLKADGSVDTATYLTTATAGTNYVDLSTAQTVAGNKTFTSPLTTSTLNVKNGLNLGNLGQQLIFSFPGTSTFDHYISTGHDNAQVLSNKMDFFISKTDGTKLDVLSLRSSGSSKFLSPDGIEVTGSVTAKNYVLTVPAATTAAATTTIDLSSGNIIKVNLGANITTLDLINASPGTYIIQFIQGGTNTVTFPTTNWKWSGGSAPTITAVSGKTDIITIVFDGTTYFASAVQNF